MTLNPNPNPNPKTCLTCMMENPNPNPNPKTWPIVAFATKFNSCCAAMWRTINGLMKNPNPNPNPKTWANNCICN